MRLFKYINKVTIKDVVIGFVSTAIVALIGCIGKSLWRFINKKHLKKNKMNEVKRRQFIETHRIDYSIYSKYSFLINKIMIKWENDSSYLLKNITLLFLYKDKYKLNNMTNPDKRRLKYIRIKLSEIQKYMHSDYNKLDASYNQILSILPKELLSKPFNLEDYNETFRNDLYVVEKEAVNLYKSYTSGLDEYNVGINLTKNAAYEYTVNVRNDLQSMNSISRSYLSILKKLDKAVKQYNYQLNKIESK